MTSKERLLIALQNGKADRVPVTPDISNMIPCKLTGKPFWEIYMVHDPITDGGPRARLARAYLSAVKHFGFDGWGQYVDLGPSKEDKKTFRREIIEKNEGEIIAIEYFQTPEGTLSQEVVYPIDNPPTIQKKIVKDFRKDFPVYLKYWFPDPSSCDDREFQKWKGETGDTGIAGIAVVFPGFQQLIGIIDGGDKMSSLEAVTYAYYDYPDMFREYALLYKDWAVKMTERIIKAKPDFILTGGSGTMTLQSPEIFRELGLPTLKKITRLAKEAGIPTLVHSCGKEKELVKICAEETDLSCINPLEIPPMGDCDLKKLKEKYGNKIALMGNLHTTEVMLKGSVKDVEEAAKKAIDDAGENGGFILSTGDQCGRDTPEDNIFMMIETAKTYGRY